MIKPKVRADCPERLMTQKVAAMLWLEETETSGYCFPDDKGSIVAIDVDWRRPKTAVRSSLQLLSCDDAKLSGLLSK